MAAEQEFAQALRALVAALDELAVPSMIIGGVAVIAAGVARQTIDIDATVLGKDADVDVVFRTLARACSVVKTLSAATPAAGPP